MLAYLVFLLPLAAGWCFAAALLSTDSLRPNWAGRVLEAALGAGAGVAISSVLFFLMLLAHLASAPSIVAVNAALLVAGAWVAFRRRRAPGLTASIDTPAFRWNWLLALSLAAGFALVLSGLLDVASAGRYGEWDAWSIWNLRAKFMAGPGDAWKGAVSPLLERSHPDYPLLLSGFIAMIWKVAGDSPTWVPQATSFLFLALVLGLLVSALTVLRSFSAALLAGFAVLASTSFLFLATMQYADLPLSFYLLGAIVLLLLSSREEPGSRLYRALAGFFASCAAWTKNEGILFAGLLLAVTLVLQARDGGVKSVFRRWLPLALGAAPVLLLVGGFKLFLAPPADPFLHQNAAQIAQKLGDAGRYSQIGKALLSDAYHYGQPWSHPLLLLAILAFALGFRIDEKFASSIRGAAIALALVFASYCGAYLITPNDLAWHLQTSLARLYSHLWPSALLLAFMVLRRPEDRRMPSLAHSQATPKSKAVRAK
jgi:hypothetical protein